jgi:hypothetical protein
MYQAMAQKFDLHTPALLTIGDYWHTSEFGGERN